MRWNVLGHNRISSEGTMKDFMARRILVDFEWTSTSISWRCLVMPPGMAAGAFLIAGAGSGRLFFHNRS
jgi:hypothetical protein